MNDTQKKVKAIKAEARKAVRDGSWPFLKSYGVTASDLGNPKNYEIVIGQGERALKYTK